jgi:hypothetical protein
MFPSVFVCRVAEVLSSTLLCLQVSRGKAIYDKAKIAKKVSEINV